MKYLKKYGDISKAVENIEIAISEEHKFKDKHNFEYIGFLLKAEKQQIITVNNNTKIDPIKIGKYLWFNTYLVEFDQENISGMIKNYINEKHILINK